MPQTSPAPENPDKAENLSGVAGVLEYSPFSPLPGPGVQTERMRAACAALEAARAYRRPQPKPGRGGDDRRTHAVVSYKHPTPARAAVPPRVLPPPAPAPVPDDWAQGVAKLATMPGPATIESLRWSAFVGMATRLLHDHGPELHAAGWTSLDLFGLHGLAPVTYGPGWGLAWLLGARGEVLNVAADAVGMRWHPVGARLTFRRRPVTAGAVPAWVSACIPEKR